MAAKVLELVHKNNNKFVEFQEQIITHLHGWSEAFQVFKQGQPKRTCIPYKP